MFYCLAASLNYVFKWISMFDQDQTFSPNSLPHKQNLFVRQTFNVWSFNYLCQQGLRKQEKSDQSGTEFGRR